MNIKHENVPGQLQEVVIEVNKEDYAANLEAALKHQRRTVTVPGFRPGNAPMGMIKKMYEKNLLLREVDKLLNENLEKFFNDNKIKYIFEPMPVEEKSQVDFDQVENFVFTYEYALAPEVTIDYAKLPSVVDFSVLPTEEDCQEYIYNLRDNFGKFITSESVGDDDNVSVKYGEGKDGFFISKELNEEAIKTMLGKKVGESFTLSLRNAFIKDSMMLDFLRIKKEEEEIDNDYTFEFTIEHIGHVQLADLNEEFFAKAFPNAEIKTEEQFRAEVQRELALRYKRDEDQQFLNNAIEMLLENVEIALPNDFIKRYLIVAQKDMTEENLEKEFDRYLRSIKWQLLEEKIVEGEDVKVTADDVKGYFRNYFIKNYFGGFNAEEVKDRVEEIVNQSMNNKENVKEVYDMLFDEKIIALLRKKLNIEHKEGDFKSFVDMIVSSKQDESKPEEAEAPKKTTKRKTAAKKELKSVEAEVETELEGDAADPVKEEKPKKTRAKKSTKEEK